jgi:hypothetical protein
MLHSFPYSEELQSLDGISEVFIAGVLDLLKLHTRKLCLKYGLLRCDLFENLAYILIGDWVKNKVACLLMLEHSLREDLVEP